ncbi:hypothetical protein CR513_57628, partial [Mucuna pruriens]
RGNNVNANGKTETLTWRTLDHTSYNGRGDGYQTVSLAFMLGKYSDEYPWKLHIFSLGDHDNMTAGFSFEHKEQKVILKPLLLKEVNEDQVMMKLGGVGEKKKEQKEKERKNGDEKKTKEDRASKGTECPKKKSEKKKSMEGKQIMMMSWRVVLKRCWKASKKFFPRTSNEDCLQSGG